MNSKSQCDRILGYMKTHGAITDAKAREKFGVTRLAARIYDLRALGYEIDREMKRVKNRYGEVCRVAVYRLVKS